jgi:hypothetical protein
VTGALWIGSYVVLALSVVAIATSVARLQHRDVVLSERYQEEIRTIRMAELLTAQRPSILSEAFTEIGASGRYIGLYAFEWGRRVLMRGGGGRVEGQLMPPAWSSTRSR